MDEKGITMTALPRQYRWGTVFSGLFITLFLISQALGVDHLLMAPHPSLWTQRILTMLGDKLFLASLIILEAGLFELGYFLGTRLIRRKALASTFDPIKEWQERYVQDAITLEQLETHLEHVLPTWKPRGRSKHV